MENYIEITAAEAVERGLVKEGDEILLKLKIYNIYHRAIDTDSIALIHETILIPTPKIDFSVAGRILQSKYEDGRDIVMTTGHKRSESVFSAYVLESDYYGKGLASYDWRADHGDWTDITDTYTKS